LAGKDQPQTNQLKLGWWWLTLRRVYLVTL